MFTSLRFRVLLRLPQGQIQKGDLKGCTVRKVVKLLTKAVEQLAVLILCITPHGAYCNPPASSIPVSGSTGDTSMVSQSASEKIASNGVNAAPTAGFGQMSFEDRARMGKEISKQDLSTMFQTWINSRRLEHDPTKQYDVGNILAESLRMRPPEPEVYAQIKAFIENTANPERGQVLTILGETRTRESLELLIQEATNLPAGNLKKTASALIVRASNLVGDGKDKRRQDELSPPLNSIWHVSHDKELLSSTAIAMARLGAPHSIELLLGSALGDGNQEDGRPSWARMMLIEATYKKEAVPPLAARLTNQAANTETAKLIVPTLVRIGDTTAAKVVIEWLETTNSSAEPFVSELIVRYTRTVPMLAAWKAALNPAVRFHDDRIREAIRDELDLYERGSGLNRVQRVQVNRTSTPQ
jgi:hypothetical protein